MFVAESLIWAMSQSAPYYAALFCIGDCCLQHPYLGHESCLTAVVASEVCVGRCRVVSIVVSYRVGHCRVGVSSMVSCREE